MPEITKAIVDEFSRIAEWDDIKWVWVYKEDRYGSIIRGVMKRKGDTISSCNSRGYYRVVIYGKPYLLHRLAYCIYHNAIIDNSTILDHANGCRLDNSKENLRISNNMHNTHNRLKKPSTSSKYIGVSWHKNEKKWHVSICTNNKGKHLGYFVSEIDAAKAYNAAAKRLYGDTAKLNSI